MYCRKCGKQINEGAAFCPNCGFKITTAPAESMDGKSKKKNLPIILAAIVGIVLLLGVVLFLKENLFSGNETMEVPDIVVEEPQAEPNQDEYMIESEDSGKYEDTEQNAEENPETEVGAISLDEGEYRYQNGEYVSELSIYEENGVKKATLMFWHDYGESSSDEDFFFVWENGKWQYSLIGNRTGEAFLMEVTPTENGINMKLTQQEWNGTYSWPDGNNTAEWVDAEYLKMEY